MRALMRRMRKVRTPPVAGVTVMVRGASRRLSLSNARTARTDDDHHDDDDETPPRSLELDRSRWWCARSPRNRRRRRHRARAERCGDGQDAPTTTGTRQRSRCRVSFMLLLSGSIGLVVLGTLAVLVAFSTVRMRVVYDQLTTSCVDAWGDVFAVTATLLVDVVSIVARNVALQAAQDVSSQVLADTRFKTLAVAAALRSFPSATTTTTTTTNWTRFTADLLSLKPHGGPESASTSSLLIQSSPRTQTPTPSEHEEGWTAPRVHPDTGEVGVSFTTRVASPENLTVVGTLTMDQLATYAVQELCSYANARETINNTNIITNDTLLFIMDRDASVFLAGATGGGVRLVPNRLVSPADPHATNPGLPDVVGAWRTIQRTSMFLAQTRATSGGATPPVMSFHAHSLQRCDVRRTIADPTQKLNLTFVTQCNVVSVAPVTDHQHQHINWLVVFVVSHNSLVTPIVDSALTLRANADSRGDANDELVASAIRSEIAYAGVVLLLGLGLGAVLAYRVTLPLSKLSVGMERLRRLDYDESTAPKISRVVDVARVQRAFLDLQDAVATFERFLPQTVVKSIIRGNAKAQRLHVERRCVSILFSDVCDFTTISERLDTTDLLFFLTRYLTCMTAVVESYGGVVTEILGDGLLALFNAPDDLPNHEAMATAAALAMQRAVHEHLVQDFDALFRFHALAPLTIRVGINSGRVLAGNIGSATKLKYGVVGDAVNTAARLEGLCKAFKVDVLVSEFTFAALPPDVFASRKVDVVRVKGKEAAIAVYQVVAMDGVVALGSSSFGPIPAPNAGVLHDVFAHYGTALAAFQRGDFAVAETAVDAALRACPTDGPSLVLLPRIRSAKAELASLSSTCPNAAEAVARFKQAWTGINRFNEKFE